MSKRTHVLLSWTFCPLLSGTPRHEMMTSLQMQCLFRYCTSAGTVPLGLAARLHTRYGNLCDGQLHQRSAAPPGAFASLFLQGVVGVTGQLSFEAPIGQKASSFLELHNEGSTAIYYYWRRQALRHTFREAGGHGYSETGGRGCGQSFYFNSSTGNALFTCSVNDKEGDTFCRHTI